MNLRQLHYFIILAQELSFTRAAQRLHISQPPLSRQIAELEASLNVKLFNRSSRRVELTEPGEVFLRDVQMTFERLQRATLRAQAIEQGLEGRIDVGLSSSHFMGPLPGLIAAYAKAYPGVIIALNEMEPAEQVHALMERRVDVNISRIPVNDSLLRSVPLWRDPVVVALPCGHALARHESLRFSNLKDEKLVVLRPETSLFAQMVYERFIALGMLSNVVQTIAEVPAQVSLVAAGLGVAVVPLSVCTRFTEVQWCHLDESGVQMDVFAVMRHDTNKRALGAFVEGMKKMPTTSVSGSMGS